VAVLGATQPRGTSPRLLVLLFVVVALLNGCAGRRAHPRLPSPPTPELRGRSTAEAIVRSALALENVPYRNGGTDRSGFDCSGLVQYVFGGLGIAVPRSVREQYEGGQPVDRDALKPGDLVFFSTVSRGPSHVGILVDDDVFVHAPSGRGVVREERLSGSYWARRYVGARRYW
jgi:cell wall-associated NlpC family hydrolase